MNFRPLAAIILMIALHAALPTGSNAADKTPPPSRFGILLPLSGSLKALGAKVLDGALMGSSLLIPDGARGPVFYVADSEGDPEKAAAGVEELAAKGVLGIVGPLKGESARAAAKAARKLGVPLITVTPARDVAGGGVFRLYLRETEEMEKLARYAIDSMGFRRFAILSPDTDQGKLYRQLFWDAVVKNGGEIAGSEVFTPSDNVSLKEQIQRLTGVWGLTKEEVREHYERERLEQQERERSMLSSLGSSARGRAQTAVRNRDFSRYKPAPIVDFDAVFIPVSSLEAGQLASQFPYYDVSGLTLLGIRSWNYSALTRVGKEYVEGARFPVEWSPATPEGKAFSRDFEAYFGRIPGPLEAYGFDAAALFMTAWIEGHGQSRQEVAAYLAALSGAGGVTGPLTTTPEGDIATEPKFMTVRNRTIIPVQWERR